MYLRGCVGGACVSNSWIRTSSQGQIQGALRPHHPDPTLHPPKNCSFPFAFRFFKVEAGPPWGSPPVTLDQTLDPPLAASVKTKQSIPQLCSKTPTAGNKSLHNYQDKSVGLNLKFESNFPVRGDAFFFSAAVWLG